MIEYWAERGGRIIKGDRQYVAEMIGVRADYIRKMVREGITTKSGWTVTRAGDTLPETRGVKPTVFYAEHPDDDPIIGSIQEISLLLGVSHTTIGNAIHRGGAYRGWTIRPATLDEIEEAERRWG